MVVQIEKKCRTWFLTRHIVLFGDNEFLGQKQHPIGCSTLKALVEMNHTE